MTCDHCVRAVTAELLQLSGVRGVTVDLVPEGTSSVAVTSNAPVPEDALAEALDEAGGYQLRAQ